MCFDRLSNREIDWITGSTGRTDCSQFDTAFRYKRMNNMQELFFELIQVAIGRLICLSRTPSEKEWKELYDIAKKQSLVGVCFAGVQRLQGKHQKPPELLYLTWMGMAAKIQQRNQIVDEQCLALQKQLTAKRIESSILKGQGVAQVYAEHLRGLRQSGDIDVYVDCGRKRAIEYTCTIQQKVDWDYKHLHLEAFPDTEVEMHYVPEYLANLVHNRRFQRWVCVNQEHAFGRKVKCGEEEIVTPDAFFNCVYVLAHIYNHNMRAGVGLRQLMDYYFVLTEQCLPEAEKKEICNVLWELGMQRYASGIMWLLQNVFGMKDEYLLCSPNLEEGEYILDGVLIGGNMGRGYKTSEKKKPFVWGFISSTFRYSARTFSRYPMEVLSYPIWTVYHFVWKRVWGWKNGV